jgi:CMP-N-acetylneuraminic acid synthetase
MTVASECKILALIPARSKSKGIVHKNILPFRGKPLLAHSIERALSASTPMRVVVSTDDPGYAEIARRYGAETPFLRPAEISGDFSLDIEVFRHALEWFSANEGWRPDICVHLRPTYPTRRVEDIDEVVRLLTQPPECDSVRSVTLVQETPFKAWFMDERGLLSPVVCDPRFPEAYNRPRQELPPAYQQNAAVDACWSRVIIEQNSMTGTRIRGYVMEEFKDIDTPEQFKAAELPGAAELSGKTFVVDIDGVIATLTPGNDYTLAGPQERFIRVINALHDRGNRIVLLTARGSMTGIDWGEVTRNQLELWGVRYDELRFGKPAADYYVDDRMMSLADFLALAPNDARL